MKKYTETEIRAIRDYQSAMRGFHMSPSEYSGKQVAFARDKLIKLNISIKEACLY